MTGPDPASPALGFGPEPSGQPAPLDSLRAVADGVALCWLGNLSWLIAAGGRLIATDLDLDGGNRIQPSPIATDALAPALDVHLVTHGHGDHFGPQTARILAARSGCTFVVPANCADKARAYGIPPARIHIARPGEPFDLPGVHVEPQRALHGHWHGSVYRGANMEDCGYLITIAGTRLFQPGDSVLLHEHLEMQGVDVLFVSPTDHNMGVTRAAIWINAVEPAHVLPQHYGTYHVTEANRYWTVGYPDELRAILPRRMRDRFHKLALGEVYAVVPPGAAP